jgi:hypothetical protein
VDGIVDWTIRQVAQAFDLPAELVVRPRSVQGFSRGEIASARRVAACALRRLGLKPRQIAAGLQLRECSVRGMIRKAKVTAQEAALVADIVSRAGEQGLSLASDDSGSLTERVAMLEQRLLALESAVRAMRSPDFRRLDALILAGWGDVRQDKIPTDVLIRALLGLPVPPPDGQAQPALDSEWAP